jgi:hypothetical protein
MARDHGSRDDIGDAMPTNLISDKGPNARRPSGGPAFRKLLTRAEAVTLLGMILVVFSVFAVWQYVPMPGLPPGIGGIGAGAIIRHGTGVLGGKIWVLLGSAIAAATLLMWNPTERSRQPLALLQGLCGLVCVGIALRFFQLQVGVLVALAGGALLIYGAYDRMTARP